MPIRLESLTAIPALDVGQLASELLSADAQNTAELDGQGRILVRPPEDQEFTPDLVSIYRISS